VSKKVPNGYAGLVQQAAIRRGKAPVERQCIEEALQRIESGEEKVAEYQTGTPAVGAVYDLAARLQKESVQTQTSPNEQTQIEEE